MELPVQVEQEVLEQKEVVEEVVADILVEVVELFMMIKMFKIKLVVEVEVVLRM
jgi:hypothetical protein